MHRFTVDGWERRKQKNLIVGSTNCCWHFSRVTQTDREYGLMSSSKIGLVKITCHESLHSSHDVEFLHSYQQSYTSTWDKLLRSQCVVFENIIWLQKYNWEYLYTERQYIQSNGELDIVSLSLQILPILLLQSNKEAWRQLLRCITLS